MTDTQERVDINQITNNQRFGFSRRLLNSFIAREWFTYWVIAAVVVIGALYHHHSINSQEARFETTVEKMLDKREKKSRAFVEEAVKITETNMARKLETRFETVEKMLDEREKGSRAFIEAAVKTSETNMAGKFDMLRRLLVSLDIKGRTRFRAPIAEETFLQMSSTWLPQESWASIVRRKDLVLSTLLII
ncbi:uncharacterized protein LOC111347151 isoform X1 [Stylophora pistillata]|uniref:uncharacterized protein LOC111347151 isoform X1 n=1 Tax=Stylophora pistillata TaxID=50429 RepID=UPI000C044250|nr:uncharacterized protein LOC111347151 isoform X1 [Stylophora pistillata]